MTTISWPEAAAFTLASAVKDAVAQFTAVGIDSARLDAEMLMAETLRVERGRLYMNPDRALDDAALARFRALIARRARGEPVSYITGRREFWSLDFVVTPAVLTPRPETELPLEAAAAVVSAKSPPRTLDLGTARGATACAMAQERIGADIVAPARDLRALENARATQRLHGLEDRM